MAGAEVATIELASIGNGYAAKMGANTHHNQPFGVDDAVVIVGAVTQLLLVYLLGRFYVRLRTLSNENRFTAPVDHDVLAHVYVRSINLNECESQLVPTWLEVHHHGEDIKPPPDDVKAPC